MLSINTCIRCAVRTRPQISHLFRGYARPASTKSIPSKPVLSQPVVVRRTANPRHQRLEDARYKTVRLAEELYAKDEVLLYKAPRHLTYLRLQIWGIVGLSGSFLAWYYGYKVYDVAILKQKGVKLPWFVAIGESLAAVFVAVAMGAFLLRSSNHVQTIRIVKEIDTVFLRLSVRSIFPGVKTHIAVRPYDLDFDERIVWPRSPPNWMVARKLNESSASAVMLSVLGNTLRAFPRFFWQIWNQGRRLITYDGLVDLKLTGTGIKSGFGRPYHLDIDGAFLLHETKGKSEMVLYSMNMHDFNNLD